MPYADPAKRRALQRWRKAILDEVYRALAARHPDEFIDLVAAAKARNPNPNTTRKA